MSELLGGDAPLSSSLHFPLFPQLLEKKSRQVIPSGHIADSGTHWGSDPGDPPDPRASV